MPIALLRGREKAFSSWNKRKNSCRNNFDHVIKHVQIQKQPRSGLVWSGLQTIIVNAEVSGVGGFFVRAREDDASKITHLRGRVVDVVMTKK